MSHYRNGRSSIVSFHYYFLKDTHICNKKNKNIDGYIDSYTQAHMSVDTHTHTLNWNKRKSNLLKDYFTKQTNNESSLAIDNLLQIYL